ncbi:protein RALF-like 19 [Lycium barbarum]|uniref:protein RALF-like 19 n=1 Tax=Lycium ferocissimum TaxID=112874 RepID=UPI002814E6B9|nr:protein RALF-like 19 [Lycium ferocissimum]XP_060210804.1 protein RALF-like 19 [Lycium barbarum]
MAIRSRLTVMLMLTLAMAMVAESSFSHLDSATIAFARMSNDNSGRVGDTLDVDEEMMMPSESARRSVLNARDDHISYRAMSKNQIPCDQRGQSYYNACNRMSKINPYRRGCSRITNCERTNS